MKVGDYPITPRRADIAEIGGLRVPDPYKWLEGDDTEVRAWDAQQNALADAAIANWPYAENLRRQVDHFLAQRPALPRLSGEHWYRLGRASDGALAIIVSDTPFGEGEALSFSLLKRGAHEPVITWLQPAPNGQTIAFGVCYDGSENNFIHLLDVESGQLRADAPPHVLMDAWMGGLCWLPDSSGFYFLALDEDRSQFLQHIVFHDVARGAQSAVTLPNHDPRDYTLISASADGAHLIAHHGLFSPAPIAVLDLADADPHWRPFVSDRSCALIGVATQGVFYAISYNGAPRGRLVRITLDALNPSDRSCWDELVGETDLVLRSVSLVAGMLFVTAFDQASSRVLIFTQSGAPVGEIPLARPGALSEPHFLLMTQALPQRGDQFLFVWSSFTSSWGIFAFDPIDRLLRTIVAPQIVRTDLAVEQFEALSSDGASAPYHVVRLAGAAASPRPALLYAYGAFNVPTLCAYPAAMTAFIASGGAYVHAHIRGGGEYGITWWQSGAQRNKYMGVADLYAIAEDLERRGITSPDLLAMTGASNGGLVASLAAIERPALWRVVVPQVPVTDLVGLLHDPYGRYVVAHEFARIDEAGEVDRILRLSPYHRGRDVSALPAMFIDAGATDPRCPPWHARKLAATLQERAPSTRIALRVREGVGHGFATPRKVQVELYAEWLAFVMQELGMTPGRSAAA